MLVIRRLKQKIFRVSIFLQAIDHTNIYGTFLREWIRLLNQKRFLTQAQKIDVQLDTLQTDSVIFALILSGIVVIKGQVYVLQTCMHAWMDGLVRDIERDDEELHRSIAC